MIGDKQVMGFIPDIYRILHKFNLIHVLESFIKYGVFPSKATWKNTIKINVNFLYMNDRNTKLDMLLSQHHYMHMFKSPDICIFWSIYKQNKSLKAACYNAVKILGKMFSYSGNELCTKCEYNTNNLLSHKIFHCTANSLNRDSMWLHVISFIGITSFFEYTAQNVKDQLLDLLTGFENYESSTEREIRISTCLTDLLKLTI